jgi:hypothetical protein
MIRIIGPTGSRRRRGALLAAIVSLILVTLVLAPAAQGAYSTLDGGTVNVEVADKTTSQVNKPTNEQAFISYFGDSDTTFGASGTGLFDPFVRLQASPSEQGYNTTSGNTQFDTKVGNWTHPILVSQIPQRPCPDAPATGGGAPPPPALGSLTCFELFVDINESNTAKHVSLNKVEVYFTTLAGGAITGYPTGGFTDPSTTKQYAFSGNILINDVNQGSGRGDLRYDIPINNGAGRSITLPPGCFYGSTTCTTYFVLYSQWGFPSGPSSTYNSEGGFEEWKVKIYPTKTGMKFNDLNANGVKDSGEPGVSGVTINAYADTNGDGILQAGEQTTPPATSGTTDGTGTYALTFPSAGKYVVCEVLPAGFVQSAPSNTICSAGTGLGAGGYAETLAAGSRLTGNDFGNHQASLMIKKTAKDARATGGTALLGGATFKISPDPLDGVGDLTVTDDGTGDALNTSPGVICIDQVIPGTYSVEETAAPTGYNKASPATQTGITTSPTLCAARTSTGTPDVTFVNTPLSEIQVKFKSLADGNTAGTGVTRASIVCAQGTTTLTPKTPGENGSADPAFDDSDETFTDLAPGTYTCTVVIDP